MQKVPGYANYGIVGTRIKKIIWGNGDEPAIDNKITLLVQFHLP